MKQSVILFTLALGACVAELDDGRGLFLKDCASCHGLDGRGDGVNARTLSTSPPDLTQIAARNGGIFPRTRVMSTIDGLDRAAHFSPEMPEFGAGDMGDVVVVEEAVLGTPVPYDLLLLTQYLEQIQE